MTPRIKTWLVGLTAAVVVATPTVAAADTRDPHRELTESYSSLSASLIGFYADSSGMTLQSYLTNQDLLLKPATLPDPALEPLDDDSALPGPGTSDPAASAGADFDFSDLDVATLSAQGGMLLSADQAGQLADGSTGISATDIGDLNAQLDEAGVSINAGKYKNLSQLARAVTRSARTPDGAVTLASAKWLKSLSTLRSPKLSGPDAPAAAMPGVPADALPLGLLMNKSLTNLVTNHPNLIQQAQNNAGLGSNALLGAWNQSMAQAYRDSGQELTGLLPNPCVGEMMGVMATGKKTRGSGCAPACAVAGQYLHYQAGAAFNPSQNSMAPNMDNPAGGILNNASLKDMNVWAQQLMVTQNPELAGPSELAQPGNSAASCTTASKSARNTLDAKLPGLFNGLK